MSMRRNRIIASVVSLLLFFSCVPMTNMVQAQEQMNFTQLKGKFSRILSKIAQSEDARIDGIFEKMKLTVKEETDTTGQLWTIDHFIGVLEKSIRSEYKLEDSKIKKYLDPENITVDQFVQSLQLFHLFKIFTVSERIDMVNKIEAGEIPAQLTDKEKELVAKIDSSIPELKDALVSVQPGFDLEMYAYVLLTLQGKTNKPVVIDAENGKLDVEIPESIGELSDVRGTIDKALRGLTISGYTYPGFDEMTKTFVDEVNAKLTPAQIRELKLLLAEYGLYKATAPVLADVEEQPADENGNTPLKATVTLPKANGKTQEAVVQVPLSAKVADELGLPADTQLEIKLPPLSAADGKVSLTIKKAAAAANVTKAILAIEITVEGLDGQKVTLSLPIPQGVDPSKAGAFHKNNITGRWDFREVERKGHQLEFETDLSAVAIAEAVEVPTITETTKTTNSVTLKWTSSVSGGTYEIYKGTTLVGTTEEKTYTVTDLSPSTAYTFKVRAVDSENFESDFAQKTETTSASPSSGGGVGPAASSGTTVTIKAGQSGTVKADGVTITLPTGAFGKDVKVTVKAVSSTSSLPMPSIMKLISQVFEITKDEAGKFDKPVTITLSFDKSKVDLEKYDLAIFWLDEEAKEWIQLDNVKVDLEKATVSGDVDHFTKFAVLAVEKEALVPVPAPKVELTDIKGHWAESNILKLVETGAISGYPDKTFKPNNNITRAEFATVLVKAFDLEAKTGKVFADTANHWAKDAIATAAAYGIVSGYSADTFGPNDLITREQMAAMIVKAAGLDTALTSKDFTDSKSISAWAVDAVNTAAEQQIINGYPDNSFRPQGKATRAEAVTVIVNALK
ncbi:MAG: S-layer homology domain-containing protein [Thermotaleaceae bacterium]